MTGWAPWASRGHLKVRSQRFEGKESTTGGPDSTGGRSRTGRGGFDSQRSRRKPVRGRQWMRERALCVWHRVFLLGPDTTPTAER